MARYGYGMSVSGSRKSIVASSGGGLITTSRAFNSSGVQVGPTITGDIPEDWVNSETTVTSVIFANNNSVTSIGSRAFYSCTSLTSITIPNSVTSIGNYAFRDCADLTTTTIGNSVTSIGNYAFRGCGSLASITIPNSVTSIGSYAFSYCFALNSATIGTSVTTIGSFAFQYCSGITSITIPDSVTSIGDYAFRESTNLATVLCYVAQSAFTGSGAFYLTASPLTIRVPTSGDISDTWTAGTGLTFQGNTNVTVIKNL